LIAAIGHGLALSNSFAAIVHGLSSANSSGAFRFSVAQVSSHEKSQKSVKIIQKINNKINMIFDSFLLRLGCHVGSLWAPKSTQNRPKFDPRRLLKRYLRKNVNVHEKL
jgi:hypothetical protein